MTMRVTRINDAEPFKPVGHEGVGPVRLQGGDSTPTTDFTVALSHYLPGGAAELAPQVAETVYVILSGELVMNSDGAEETLGALDSVHFTPGTTRTVANRTNLPASMLVIRATS
jgi:mannose-6-phosphate isomerase-like protein (cupin superfamily)